MKEDFTKNPYFCYAPFVCFHSTPSGAAFPCCIVPWNQPFGDTNRESVEKIRNNESFKNLRKKMIHGERPTACENCYKLDESNIYSTRKDYETKFNHLQSIINNNSDNDGTIKNLNLKSIDIRSSNLCNLKCRTCGPDFSSEWYEDGIKLHRSQNSNSKVIATDHVWDEILSDDEKLEDLEDIYLAGGEPLINPKHNPLLEKLLEKNLQNIWLRYSTNLNVSETIFNKSISLWSQFKNVFIGASCEAIGAPGEYARDGLSWEKFLKLSRKLKNECPHISFSVVTTLSLYNCFEFIKLHRFLVENEIIKSFDDFIINIVFDQKFFRIQCLPKGLKKRLEKEIKAHISFLAAKKAKQNIINEFQGVLNFLYEEDNSQLFQEFIDYNLKLDKIREQSFFSIFPYYKL